MVVLTSLGISVRGQRWVTLRQAHFITSSEKGLSEPSWMGYDSRNSDRKLTKCQAHLYLRCPNDYERQSIYELYQSLVMASHLCAP
jgi:hypothetical protein